MKPNQEEQIANLRAAYESGALDKATYEAAVTAILGATFQAEVKSGAAAQGEGATAVGQQGVSAGDVQGHIVTGDGGKAVQAERYYENYYEADPGAAVDVNALRRAYLGRVLEQTRLLPLAGIDRAEAQSDDPHTAADGRLPLTSVYTALLTTASEGGGREFHDLIPGLLGRGGGRTTPISALRQLVEQKHLVLLGDPGSGKSVFVNFVAACLAGEALAHPEINLALLTAPLPNDEGNDSAEPQAWPHGPLLPLPIILRDLAAEGLPPAEEEATAEHLWAFLTRRSHTPAFIPHLRQIFEQEGGLLLLDGLDEVPESESRRAQIQQLVADLKATLPQARILVTSRIYAYRQTVWQLAGFSATLLAPFNWGQIRRFIERWYDYTAAARGWSQVKAEQEATLLRETIANRPELRDLAERPLLLTLMASLHAWRGGTLPGKRAQLYNETVELLLDRWEEQRKVYDPQTKQLLNKGLAEVMKVTKVALRRALEKLAYEAHARQPNPGDGQPADLTEEIITQALLSISQREDLQPRLLAGYLRDRAGLLIDRGGGVYSFPHRTFQEFLAACYAADRSRNEAMTEAARRDPSRWREVLLLSVAHANENFGGAAWDFIPFLCWEEAATEAEGRLTNEELWGAHLAGLALLEVETDPAAVGRRDQPALRRVRERLTLAMRDERLPAIERAQAGVSLAHLGDTRAEVLDVDAMPFCYAPPGKFWMGDNDAPQDDDSDIQDVFDSMKPAHEVNIPYGYWLGQYPVSNAQFQMFVEEGGYGQETYWPEAAAHGFWQEGKVRGYSWISAKGKVEQLRRDQPYDYGRPFNLPNHPVVGVNWYEALAFSRWLTGRWQAAGLLPPDWRVVLPSEAEWEKGARGGLAWLETPVIAALPDLRGRLNPALTLPDAAQTVEPTWGPETGNYADSKIKATNAVGCFPRGRSPYGCEEMLGNVWEWTRSLYGRYDRDKSESEKKLVFDPWYRYPYQSEDGRERLDRDDDWARVLRGSSFVMDERWQRCGARLRDLLYNHHRYLGFRLALSPFFDSGP